MLTAGEGAGKKVVVMMTDMSQPLGYAIYVYITGNADSGRGSGEEGGGDDD
jgi:thymidine phosphorylase